MPDNDKKQAYLEAQPGDLIRAEDWNKMQVKIRKALNEHNHHGGLDQGGPLDAGAIDPGSELKVKGLNIKGNLKVAGTYHSGEVLGGYLQAEEYSYHSKEKTIWEELWSGEIEIKKDSIIQLTIMGHWCMTDGESGAFLCAMIDNKPINPPSEEEVHPWGMSRIQGAKNIIPIGYSAVHEVKKGVHTLGVGVMVVAGQVEVEGMRLYYLVIPK